MISGIPKSWAFGSCEPHSVYVYSIVWTILWLDKKCCHRFFIYKFMNLIWFKMLVLLYKRLKNKTVVHINIWYSRTGVIFYINCFVFINTITMSIIWRPYTIIILYYTIIWTENSIYMFVHCKLVWYLYVIPDLV